MPNFKAPNKNSGLAQYQRGHALNSSAASSDRKGVFRDQEQEFQDYSGRTRLNTLTLKEKGLKPEIVVDGSQQNQKLMISLEV